MPYHIRFHGVPYPSASSNFLVFPFYVQSNDALARQWMVASQKLILDSNQMLALVSHLRFRYRERTLCQRFEHFARPVCYRLHETSETISKIIQKAKFRRQILLIHSPCAIHIATEFGRFQKFTPFNGRFHLITFDKMVMDTILFTLAWFSCCVGNTTNRFTQNKQSQNRKIVEFY